MTSFIGVKPGAITGIAVCYVLDAEDEDAYCINAYQCNSQAAPGLIRNLILPGTAEFGNGIHIQFERYDPPKRQFDWNYTAASLVREFIEEAARPYDANIYDANAGEVQGQDKRLKQLGFPMRVGIQATRAGRHMLSIAMREGAIPGLISM